MNAKGIQDIGLFFQRYLEKEFLKLADYIHFSDDQLGAYSMFIADLIVRCSVEIEALSKELYCMLGGNMSPTDLQGNARDLYFDTDCLDLLEQKRVISKKQIMVSTINFYFTDLIIVLDQKFFRRIIVGQRGC
ncbi:MAG TPA: hypothetical protein H9722_07585 [Candidatus Mediterraneibacter pullistercoris]|nr:hypothetical protein [Candidatus Mediterraneibacter pullistercoris]